MPPQTQKQRSSALKPVRGGNGAVVRLYPAKNGAYGSVQLSYYVGGRRVMERRATEEAARERAREVLESTADGNASALDMKPADVAAYQWAIKTLAATGKTLQEAIGEYSAAVRTLGSVPLPVAMADWSSRQPNITRTVDEVVEEFLAAKQQDKVSKIHFVNLRFQLAHFRKNFACPISDLTGPVIEKWLRKRQEEQGWNGTSRNVCRRIVANLMHFARARHYLPASWDEMKQVARATEDRGEVAIFTPEEAELLLQVTQQKHPRSLPYLAVALFAGCRKSEIERLGWGDIDLKTGYIFVRKGKVRSAGHRLVPVQPNLKAWLDAVVGTGKVCPLADMTPEIALITAAAKEVCPGFEWHQNAPRHSYISYRLAVTKNIAEVSEEAGNSAEVIRKAYRKPVSEADGVRWFWVMPS